MLAGFGGRSIAEAKENISYAEARRWMLYRQKRGSFNLGRRLEVGFALLAFLEERTRRKDVQLHEFMPHEDEPVADINDIVKMLGGQAG